MSERDSSNTHEVIGAMFRAMNTKSPDRAAAKLPRWADVFPYVNGALFSGSLDAPRFSRAARSYLLHVGRVDWTKINPDILGSMIQAVAEDEERGALGMPYTSVPNILKVLNPLFLDDLRARLEEAGDNSRMLLNLRRRLSRIRVFDPACGSGNFLVIAYKEMRAIEAKINHRRKEDGRKSADSLADCWSDRCPGAPLRARRASSSTTRVIRNRVASKRSGQRAGRPRRSRHIVACSSNQRPSGRQRRRTRCGRPQRWHLPSARSKRTWLLSSRQCGG
jgi:hypothetical protein